MNAQVIFSQSELALAAYATLNSSALSSQKASLKDAGLSDVQADTFAAGHTVVTQYNDTLAEGGLGTSLSATVFKDAAGRLTLAIRGTAELLGNPPNDLAPTDADIALNGTGYDQIVALYNWWQRVGAPPGSTVLQYRIAAGPLDPHVGIQFGTRWLEITSATATGELAAALAADADRQLDVTGHSLGGHLAMAFSTLFPGVSDQVTVFNAPGFKDSATNHAFFSALGGTVPAGLAPAGIPTTNIVADEAQTGRPPWSAIAALHSRPGTAIDIPIENQFRGDEPNPPAAKNHSQQTLTDALAVYATLTSLDPAMSPTDFKAILNAAVNGTAASLERIVDVVESTLGIDTARLGADYSQHNQNGELDLLDPTTGEGELTDRYLAERARMLTYWLQSNLTDGQRNVDKTLTTDRSYEDIARNITLLVDHGTNTSTAGMPKQKYVFGGASDDDLDGDLRIANPNLFQWDVRRSVINDGKTYQTEYFAMDIVLPTVGGNDVIYAGGGIDWVRACQGNDWVDAGAGDDIVFGEAGNDDLFGGDGMNRIDGGKGALHIGGSAAAWRIAA